MKVLSIALKDLLQQFRSTFAVGMMFGAPLLITGLLYFAFGGLGGGQDQEAAYSLPVIRLQVVNLDQGETASGINAGKMLVDLFKEPGLAGVFEMSETSDETTARGAVDRREAAVAVLIPENFTRAMLVDRTPIEVILYQDPAMNFGPGLVKEVVSQFVDGFAGAQVTAGVMAQQYQDRGQVLEPAAAANAQVEYGQYVQAFSSSTGWKQAVNQRAPASQDQPAQDPIGALMGKVMAGMLIFFLFFTSINTATTILREQEEGTLARMFTTPTPVSMILGGKFTSIFLLLAVQSVVLLAASALLFKIQWGGMVQLGLVVVGLVVVAAGSGIFGISFAKNNRQAGPLVGGLLTLTSMAGGLFTTGFENMPKFFEVTSLVVPQGWAMQAMKLVLSGASLNEIWLPVGVMLAMGIVFFALGARNFSTRFA